MFYDLDWNSFVYLHFGNKMGGIFKLFKLIPNVMNYFFNKFPKTKLYCGNAFSHKQDRFTRPSLSVQQSQEQVYSLTHHQIMCSIITKNNCQMHQEFEIAHHRLTLLMDTWDSLDYYQFNVLPILTSRIPIVKKI